MAWINRPYPIGPIVDFCDPAPPLSVWAPTPAGYDATLPNLSAATTLMPLPTQATPLLGTATLGQFPLGTPARDPKIGAFIRDQGLVAGTLGEVGQVGYVQPDAPDSAVGSFVVGESYIGVVQPASHEVLP